ncbi:8-amino-7-oxononanoate synthase [Chromobacterium sphagni]|uniref:8-amino-7-oxononanoate synthase n=1 Tax=Chromobacterium sphagni TaxID=1903179 RepID=A0A1S1X282_9NEIS|nr:8-amino-7-oxononanoate synthase [Chromobacterium sphagni]OHX13500.1 8-amino-7-oxononanoate synthase [Chromobacterium sphagni]OHX21956.1 8-amino-7-oxononanoate synthase [Chromobacterium sphagni]
MRLQDLSAALLELDASHRRRQRVSLESPQGVEIIIDGNEYLSFASNDYLGLADHPSLVRAVQQGVERWGVGSGAAHLLTGHSQAHQQAEEALARFVGREAALLFGSGYAANLAVITSLVGRGDAVFADRLNHASLNDGCLLSRADFQRFRHNDLDHLEQLLAGSSARTRLIAVDAVYSMDGDEAPLPELLALAERYDAWLYIDDAHGFGVLGQGRGSQAERDLSSERLIYMATLGKAAGLAGAFVAGSSLLVDWLVNRGRTYIFSTAQPPALAAAVSTSLRLIAEADDRRERLAQLVACCRRRLAGTAYSTGTSRTPIQPFIIGGDAHAMKLAQGLQQQGYWVPAIRPPTVPDNGARLRISLSALHDVQQLDTLLDRMLLLAES